MIWPSSNSHPPDETQIREAWSTSARAAAAAARRTRKRGGTLVQQKANARKAFAKAGGPQSIGREIYRTWTGKGFSRNIARGMARTGQSYDRSIAAPFKRPSEASRIKSVLLSKDAASRRWASDLDAVRRGVAKRKKRKAGKYRGAYTIGDQVL